MQLLSSLSLSFFLSLSLSLSFMLHTFDFPLSLSLSLFGMESIEEEAVTAAATVEAAAANPGSISELPLPPSAQSFFPLNQQDFSPLKERAYSPNGSGTRRLAGSI